MKKSSIFLSLIVGFLVYYFVKPLLESPERQVKRQTIRLLEKVPKSPESESAKLSHLAKLSTFFHFDIQLRAEYQGGVYKAESLNELRSLLLAWLRQKTSSESADYKKLTVQAASGEEGKKKVFSRFELILKRKGERAVCLSELEWTKDKKKWRIKKADISSCFFAKDRGDQH